MTRSIVVGLVPLSFCVVVGGGCGAAEMVRPEAPTAAEATGEKCDPNSESTNVFVVDLPPEKRSDLELAVGSGELTVVSFSCNEMKVLKTCKAAGRYEYKGTSAKERVLSLESGDAIRAALPLGGAGIAATFESEASAGTKFDLGLVIAGQMVGSASSFTAAELTGECTGATHVITSAKMGAYAMGTSSKAELKTAAQVFGAGAAASSNSSKLTKSRDGSVEACGASASGSDKPPGQCDAVLALELTKLKKGFGNIEVDMTFGITYADEACKDVEACSRDCNAGKGKACKELGIALIEGTGTDKNIPRGLETLNKGCSLGDVRACAAISTMLLFESRYDEALPLAEKSCSVGNDPDGCQNVGLIYKQKGELKKAMKAYEKACSSGNKVCCDLAAEVRKQLPIDQQL